MEELREEVGGKEYKNGGAEGRGWWERVEELRS